MFFTYSVFIIFETALIPFPYFREANYIKQMIKFDRWHRSITNFH